MTRTASLFLRLVTASAFILLISGCFESPESVAARQAQHNGKNVNELIAGYGTPVNRTANSATWAYQYSYYTAGPAIGIANANIGLAGQAQVLRTIYCRFTAYLDRNIVVRATYEGNGCAHFAPKT